MNELYEQYKQMIMDILTCWEDHELFILYDILCDYLSKIVPRYWAVEADVFKSDINNIVSNIKKRLYAYNDDLSDSQHIEKIRF